MAAKTEKNIKKPAYVKPEMKTVTTPKEIRDIDQPCGFYPGAGCDKRK